MRGRDQRLFVRFSYLFWGFLFLNYFLFKTLAYGQTLAYSQTLASWVLLQPFQVDHWHLFFWSLNFCIAYLIKTL